MNRPSLLFLAGLLAGCPVAGDDDDASDDDDSVAANAEVRIETSLGSFEVEVFEDTSPITAANFLAYVDEGFYDGGDGEGATVFHRVIEDFVAQGGGFTAAGAMKETEDAIVNEAVANGLSNVRGTLAMARTSDPDSATSQFYVNLVDNLFLDPGGNSVEGYAVFAVVVDGLDVVDTIGAVPTDGTDAPLTPVEIEAVERL